MWEGGFPTPSISPDTIYPEIASDSTVRVIIICVADWLQIGGYHDSVRKLQMLVARPGFYLFFWPAGSKSELLMNPSLGFN